MGVVRRVVRGAGVSIFNSPAGHHVRLNSVRKT